MGQEDQELLIRGGAASKHPSAEQLHEVSGKRKGRGGGEGGGGGKNRSILSGSVRTEKPKKKPKKTKRYLKYLALQPQEQQPNQPSPLLPPTALPTLCLPLCNPWRPQPHCNSPKSSKKQTCFSYANDLSDRERDRQTYSGSDRRTVGRIMRKQCCNPCNRSQATIEQWSDDRLRRIRAYCIQLESETVSGFVQVFVPLAQFGNNGIY